jgi:hypothetical protein
MVSVAPDGVVMVWVIGAGMWRVAVVPPEVTTETEVSEVGTVVVVVPPDGVRMCETIGDEAIETVAYPPFEVTSETGDGTDGEKVGLVKLTVGSVVSHGSEMTTLPGLETKDELGMECPETVTVGSL